MSLKKYSHEEISKISMIELASIILFDKKKDMDFRDIFKEIARLKGFSEEEKESNITQFYTDLNMDGRFMTKGSNLWGLKRWYSIDQRDEEISVAPKKKKKPAKKKKAAKKDNYEDEEELDIVDDDIEELADDLDNDADFDDEDFDDDDDEYNDYDDDEDYDDEEEEEKQK
ncbi:DNA-directed RNA polymerase subunit delta [Virgibacillus phasianinus]|uniref:Probable DNA-directed RNA polymerase subunit delta n=1 Tax=Virgibacillus phasianinus TaxID=2017483 RepID=A0A220U1T0_9BACI|nr:DNA-directed RNA polymerase subunit delta [Virgibacillus phasianinus]ASK62059.1 DNA-directed RNA polymerase subunit delta [Virgibacillus phasianinus]